MINSVSKLLSGLKTDTTHRPKRLQGYAPFKQKRCCWKRPLFLHKRESNDISILVSKSSFLHILKRMVRRLEGFRIRTQERTDFLQNLCISNRSTMFPWRAQNILQQCDLYGSLTFLTFVSEQLPEYILLFFFFGKMWIITYVEKVKNSVIISYVHLSFEYYLLLSLHLFFTLLYNSSKY